MPYRAGKIARSNNHRTDEITIADERTGNPYTTILTRKEPRIMIRINFKVIEPHLIIRSLVEIEPPSGKGLTLGAEFFAHFCDARKRWVCSPQRLGGFFPVSQPGVSPSEALMACEEEHDLLENPLQTLRYYAQHGFLEVLEPVPDNPNIFSWNIRGCMDHDFPFKPKVFLKEKKIAKILLGYVAHILGKEFADL